MKTMVWGMWVAAAGLCAACSGTPEPEPAQPELELGSARQALRIGGGGLGVTSCPGGGSPQCVQCVDVKCEYACAGGTTCDTDSWPEPGGEASLCSAGSNCRTFAFGGAALASGGALGSALLSQ